MLSWLQRGDVAMTDSVVIEENRAIGSWQQPENRWQNAPNSIHNDDVAHKVGMRGGTIPGTVHLAHFRPIIEELWGSRWWRLGSISMYYTFATTHEEDVRAIVVLPEGGVDKDADIQIDAYIENPEGRVVCKGTLAVGHPSVGYVSALELPAERGDQRILNNLESGAELGPVTDVTVEADGEEGELRDIPSMYGVLNAGFPRDSIMQPAVGFFGATEIRLNTGPIRTDESYTRTGRVVAVGESAKTEFAWVDSVLKDKDEKVVAEMRHLTRWMKVSSPLWR